MRADLDVPYIVDLIAGVTADQAASPPADQHLQTQPPNAHCSRSDDVPYEPSAEIKKAMLAAAYAEQMIERLAALQNEEVIRYTGISRAELGLRVWNAPLGEVAGRLGLKKHVLARICRLYEVPTPPKGYFRISFAHRPVRWTRIVGGA
ncbi:hypothetical protein [Bradyrhizobium arachidis]|uniref:Uncharacterized protein n=1 Tax=Bradyrhizobium arachidis TaxID=858423 RepID=A0AAE7NNE9_9BRAD|nr:hypothetical protein [Bradyrhizobium arachidis]QOZ69149.1 hypothetical protein WN72_24625 [Bradyrhizobium arachidis]SFV01120.1 hypothetical protein SAMN05192541_109302 [Bradyrhizobium arachidis]